VRKKTNVLGGNFFVFVVRLRRFSNDKTIGRGIDDGCDSIPILGAFLR
jgi:hypothetical protein